MRKINIIAINGQTYDTLTGQPLSAGSRLKPAGHTVTKRKSDSRRAASHQPPHSPAASRTLMRQAVRKPVKPGPQRHLKAQGTTDTVARRKLPEVTLKPSAHRLDQHRWQRAQHVPQSRLISRFSGFAVMSMPVQPAAETTPAVSRPTIRRQPEQTARHPQTTAELLERALQQADSYREIPPKPRRLRLRRHSHAAH